MDQPPRNAQLVRTVEGISKALGTGLKGAAKAAQEGAKSAIGFLTLFSLPMIGMYALAALSFFGTYTGLLRVLQSGDNNAGLIGTVVVFLFVFVLTVFMIYSLSEMTSSGKRLRARLPFLGTYIATMLFSVCFGFAFYWNLLEARKQSTEAADNFLTAFSREARVAIIGLDNASISLANLRDDFASRALIEADPQGGGQCGDGSGGGDGPRARHLRRRSDQINAIVPTLSDLIAASKEKAETLDTSIEAVRQLQRAESQDTDTEQRQRVFRDAENAGLALATELEALSQNQALLDAAGAFSVWAAEYLDSSLIRTDDPNGTRYQCINEEAGSNLQSVSNTLKSLPVLPTPELDAFAGPGATREAVNRFVDTIATPFRMLGGLLPRGESEIASDRIAEAAERQEAAAQLERERLAREAGSASETEGESLEAVLERANQKGIRPDDAIPLILAFFVDGLLFLAAFWSKPVEQFARLRRLIEESRGGKTRPLDLVTAAEDLLKHPQFAFLMEFVFFLHGEPYLAVPKGSGLAKDRSAAMLKSLVIAWRAGGIVVPANVSSSRISKLLGETGSDAPDRYDDFVAHRFVAGSFDAIVLQNMLSGVGPAAPAT